MDKATEFLITANAFDLRAYVSRSALKRLELSDLADCWRDLAIATSQRDNLPDSGGARPGAVSPLADIFLHAKSPP